MCKLTSTSSGIIAVALAALGLSIGHNAYAATLISDGFSGTAGTSIAGRTPDTADQGGATWVEYGTTNNVGGTTPISISPDIQLSGNNSAAFPLYTGSGAYADVGAAINFNADTSPTGGTLTASATINAANNGAEWLALGFGPSNPTNNYGPWTGGPWVLVKHTGEVQFFATGGTGNLVVDDTAAENTTGSHSIAISYDPGTSTVSLSVDGTAVTGGSYVYGGTNAAAPASWGSVFVDNRYKYSYTPIAGATDYGSFSNVLVSGTPVPEPVPLALFGVGAIGLLLLRRRHTC